MYQNRFRRSFQRKTLLKAYLVAKKGKGILPNQLPLLPNGKDILPEVQKTK